MSNPLRALVFAAVSTEEQAGIDCPSLDEQAARAEAACHANEWPIAARIRVEGHSRDYTRLDLLCQDSPAYRTFIDTVESGGVDLVVCNDYDRLWRTDALRAQVAALCRDAAVHIYSVNNAIRPESEDAAFWSELISGGVGQQENKNRVRRFRMGTLGKAKRGLSTSGYRAPWGYRKLSTREPFTPDPAAAHWARWLYEQRLAGRSYRSLAAALNEAGVPTAFGGRWTQSVIRYVLSNPFYAGLIRYREFRRVERRPGDPDKRPGRPRSATTQKRKASKRPVLLREELYPGAHEPLVSRELWDAVQELNANTSRRYTAAVRHPEHPYSTLLRCGFCGSAMTYYYMGEYTYLRCSGYTRRQCPHNNNHAAPQVHAQIRQAIRERIEDPDHFAQAVELEDQQPQGPSPVDALRAELADIDARLQRWYDAMESGEIPIAVVLKRQTELQERRRQRAADLEREQQAQTRRAGSAERWRSLAYVLDTYDDLPDAKVAQLAMMLVKCILLRRGEDPVLEPY